MGFGDDISNIVNCEKFVPLYEKPEAFKKWKDYALHLRHEIDMQQIAIDSLNAHLRILLSGDNQKRILA